MDSKKKTVIIIAGPTASGKTAFAIELAKYFNTAIISADSRQCFKELNIGVAKPSPEELQQVPHYFINSHSIHDTVTAQTFEAYALDAAGKILANNDIAIMAGGTGLYIKAFCEGLDAIPEIEANIRETIQSDYRQYGLLWLQQQVQLADPAFWQVAEQQNPQRLIRALEVFRSTGKSVKEFRISGKKQRPFNILKVGLEVSKEMLHQNINKRVDSMIELGLLGEVELMIPYKKFNALQTVGYTELFKYFDHELDLNTAIESIKRNTRLYAKRQMTWFRKEKNIFWIAATTPSAMRGTFLSSSSV